MADRDRRAQVIFVVTEIGFLQQLKLRSARANDKNRAANSGDIFQHVDPFRDIPAKI